MFISFETLHLPRRHYNRLTHTGVARVASTAVVCYTLPRTWVTSTGADISKILMGPQPLATKGEVISGGLGGCSLPRKGGLGGSTLNCEKNGAKCWVLLAVWAFHPSFPIYGLNAQKATSKNPNFTPISKNYPWENFIISYTRGEGRVVFAQALAGLLAIWRARYTLLYVKHSHPTDHLTSCKSSRLRETHFYFGFI